MDDEQDLLDAIRRVADWKGREITYERVAGGLTNANWKVTVEDKAHFVKIPGKGTESFVDRGNAHVANVIAADLGIGPDVHYYFEDTGVEIAEWLEGYRTLNFGDVFDREIFFGMIDTIRRFHHYKEKELPVKQSPFEQAFLFIGLAKQQKCYLPPEINRMEWLARQIEEAIMSAEIDYVPCHNDFCTANYLFHAESGDMRLVDFEYAAMSDACGDIADVSGSNYFTEAMDKEWVRHYYGEYDEKKFARIKLYKILKEIAWAMWSVVQAKQPSVQNFDYFEFFGAKMARLRYFWNDPRLDYWLNLLKGEPVFPPTGSTRATPPPRFRHQGSPRV